MSKRRLDLCRSERGAVLAFTAAAMVLMLAIAAITVDLAATRNDRSRNQIAADSAAAAGALAMASGSAVDGCESAVGYLEHHLGATLGMGCSGFAASCDAATPAISQSATSGTTTVTITSPVPVDDALMGSSTVGRPVVSGTDADGDACDRIAVLVTEDRAAFFGVAVGVNRSRTSVHAVALAGVDPDEVSNINLLLLNQTECAVISVNGSGNSGGVTVLPVAHPVTGELHPGSISADSDGSDCGGGGAIETSGSNAQVRADGPPGCANELASGSGHGCGIIEAYANGASDCETPACAPAPTSRSSRVTRAQLDYRWNCKSAYPASYDIDGCPEAGVSSPYIDDLQSQIGPAGVPPGFDSYMLEGHDCTVSPGDTLEVPEGNWVVDCPLSVKGTLTFLGGNIIFNGDVDIQGELRINEANTTSTYAWSPGATIDPVQHSAGAAYVYMRDGSLTKAGNGSLYMNNTFVYLSTTSDISMTGGDGPISLVAPIEGPFEDLALWTESANVQKFAGGASVTLEGVFFAPNSSVSYQGNGEQTQVAAQFIADQLTTGGNGNLTLKPIWERSVQFPKVGDVALIR